VSLLQLKKRPIKREPGQLRDDRLFYVACDDTYAPKQYFDSFELPRVQIHVVPTVDGTSVAARVLERLEAFECDPDDERWMLLDTDHCLSGTHMQGFLGAIKEARRRGVRVALSKPCFEVWLLMHHLIDLTQLSKIDQAKDVNNMLREVLGEYNKTKVRGELFPLECVVDAYERALVTDRSVAGGDAPEGVTTRVYQLWHSIVSKALPSQLPEVLRRILELGV
jgi:hypothetical protein